MADEFCTVCLQGSDVGHFFDCPVRINALERERDEARAMTTQVVQIARECIDNPSPAGARFDFDWRLKGTSFAYDPTAIAGDLAEARADAARWKAEADRYREALGHIAKFSGWWEGESARLALAGGGTDA